MVYFQKSMPCIDELISIFYGLGFDERSLIKSSDPGRFTLLWRARNGSDFDLHVVVESNTIFFEVVITDAPAGDLMNAFKFYTSLSVLSTNLSLAKIGLANYSLSNTSIWRLLVICSRTCEEITMDSVRKIVINIEEVMMCSVPVILQEASDLNLVFSGNLPPEILEMAKKMIRN